MRQFAMPGSYDLRDSTPAKSNRTGTSANVDDFPLWTWFTENPRLNESLESLPKETNLLVYA